MAEMSRMLDGNAAAGRLANVFAFEMTTARSRCARCGAVAVWAEHRLYVDAPGMILRCPACNAVVLRFAEPPGRVWLDLRGAAWIEIRTDVG